MVEESTWAWLEINDSNLFAGPLPQDVVASAFANRELYLVLANYGQEPVRVDTADKFTPITDTAATPRQHGKLAARSLQILKQSKV